MCWSMQLFTVLFPAIMFYNVPIYDICLLITVLGLGLFPSVSLLLELGLQQFETLQ